MLVFCLVAVVSNGYLLIPIKMGLIHYEVNEDKCYESASLSQQNGGWKYILVQCFSAALGSGPRRPACECFLPAF